MFDNKAFRVSKFPIKQGQYITVYIPLFTPSHSNVTINQ